MNFNYNWNAIAELMRNIKTSIEASEDRTKPLKNEKNYKNFVIITFILLMMEFASEISTEIVSNGEHQAFVHNLYFFDDTKNQFVHVMMRIISLWSAVIYESMAAILLLVYYAICLHIKSLFDQLHDKLECLNYIEDRDEKTAMEKVKACVDDQQKILSYCRETQKDFKWILTNSLITNTSMLAIALYQC
jgi:hypothetical protein